MKNLIIATLTILLFSVGCKQKINKNDTQFNRNENEAMEFVVDTEKSNVKWTGKMIGLYEHYGIVKFKDGIVKIKDDKVVGGNFVVDMNTIEPQDDNYKMAPKEKLVEHLKTDYFFNVEKFPTSSLTITGYKNDTLETLLTIRNNTNKEIVTDVKVVKNQNFYVLRGKMIFDRQKYSVSYQSKMKDKFLDNNIYLEIVIYATQPVK